MQSFAPRNIGVYKVCNSQKMNLRAPAHLGAYPSIDGRFSRPKAARFRFGRLSRIRDRASQIFAYLTWPYRGSCAGRSKHFLTGFTNCDVVSLERVESRLLAFVRHKLVDFFTWQGRDVDQYVRAFNFFDFELIEVHRVVGGHRDPISGI
jgi:hypothetical protein